MAAKKNTKISQESEGAREYVQHVLTTVFGQKPSKKTIDIAAAKVLKATPKQVA